MPCQAVFTGVVGIVWLISVLCIVFCDLCLETEIIAWLPARLQGWISQDSYPGFENSSVMDSHLFLFLCRFYMCLLTSEVLIQEP